MTSNIFDSIDDFIAELSTSIKSPSGEAVLRRINTERMLKVILEEIVQQNHDLQIRILSDSRIAGESGADILIQIDDYDIRLEIVDTSNDDVSINQDQIQQFENIFEENPSTETLILTWTTARLNSIQLSLEQIQNISSNPDQIHNYLKLMRPLEEIFKEILETHIKVWRKMLTVPVQSVMSTNDIRKLFESHFHECLEIERKRPFKMEERKKAVAGLSDQEVTKLINEILDLALDGVPMGMLYHELIQLPKWGKK